MTVADRELAAFVRAIVSDPDAALRELAATPALASARFATGASRQDATPHFLDAIGHYIYAGDSALHIAAAAYRDRVARALLAAGADVRARNRRGAEPLHYAADGSPASAAWNPAAQAATIVVLVAAGADPNALDQSGVAPLHRAVRTRCAAAVRALIDNGADPRLRNKSGSTPLGLALATTGRGGSGSADAKAQQAAIIELLEDRDRGRG